MTSRERFVAAVSHKPIDRVPIDATFEIGAYNKLVRYLNNGLPEIHTCGTNLMVYPSVEFCKQMGIDIMYLKIGSPKRVKPFQYGDDSFTTEFGLIYKRAVSANGIVDYQPINTPFADFTVEDLDNYDWPDPEDDNIFVGLRERAKEVVEGHEMALGGYFNASIFTLPSLLRGMEQWLVDLLIDEEFARRFMEIMSDYYTKLYCKALDICGEYLSFVRLDMDDFGTQNGLLISRETFNNVVRPYEEKFCRAVKEHFLKINPDGKIMKHTCGDVLELIGDFADMGIDVLNPIQPRTKYMSRELVGQRYMGRIAFWGGVDTQVTMPSGTPEEVEEDVKDCLRKLASPSGYIAGPSHHIQEDVPPENILAFLHAAQKYGTVENGKFVNL
ncbi:MAG: uroporphyrinogen decarboxylase family protein [Eubacteriales bacterium]